MGFRLIIDATTSPASSSRWCAHHIRIYHRIGCMAFAVMPFRPRNPAVRRRRLRCRPLLLLWTRPRHINPTSLSSLMSSWLSRVIEIRTTANQACPLLRGGVPSKQIRATLIASPLRRIPGSAMRAAINCLKLIRRWHWWHTVHRRFGVTAANFIIVSKQIKLSMEPFPVVTFGRIIVGQMVFTHVDTRLRCQLTVVCSWIRSVANSKKSNEIKPWLKLGGDPFSADFGPGPVHCGACTFMWWDQGRPAGNSQTIVWIYYFGFLVFSIRVP